MKEAANIVSAAQDVLWTLAYLGAGVVVAGLLAVGVWSYITRGRGL